MGEEDTLQTQTGSLPVNQGAATLRLHPLDDDVRLFQTRTLKETKEKVADSPSGWGSALHHKARSRAGSVTGQPRAQQPRPLGSAGKNQRKGWAAPALGEKPGSG